MIWQGDLMKAIDEKVRRVARSDAPVLITGETGTGKELVARRIHALSKRASNPMVAINSGAIPRELAESELFGHVKGGFTGAVKDREGKFKMADGGTIFFDEVGELAGHLQVKLLRVLEDHQIDPVGGGSRDTETVDVRVIAATRVDMDAAIAGGKFRDDLFERLNILQIHLPPLREHREDIPILVDHFIKRFGARRGVTGITPEALDVLKRYDWPRNIRQLRNVIWSVVEMRGADVQDTETISVDELPERITQKIEPGESESLQDAVDQTMKDRIERALAEAGWNVEQAARGLGTSPRTLYRRMQNLGIRPQ